MLEQPAGLAGIKYGGRGRQHAQGAHLGTAGAAALAIAESSAGGGSCAAGQAERPALEGRAAFSTIRPSTPACLWPRNTQHLPQRACGS